MIQIAKATEPDETLMKYHLTLLRLQQHTQVDRKIQVVLINGIRVILLNENVTIK